MTTPPPRVRLVDVARVAGVSKTTVSDALNGTGRLPDATREHVREVARGLGYRPNATARRLRAGRTRLLGLAAREYVRSPWVYAELAYFSQLTTAATRAALEHGYGVVLLPTAAPDDCWLDMPLDGVFVIDPVEGDPLVADFLSAGVPVVSDRRALAEGGGAEGARPARWLDFDYESATIEALDHLRAQGVERIALVTARSTSCFFDRSGEAYARWCAGNGRVPVTVASDAPGPAHVLAAVEVVLSASGSGGSGASGAPGGPPDALLVLPEISPPLLLDALRRLGRSVPDDLLVVCATEDPAAAYTDPGMSTLGYLPVESARAGVELLVDAIEGRPGPDGRLFGARLEVRASSLAAGAPRRTR
ncbi:LacI family DNA-binding transcriptional regulator [Actinomadura harenae]|uniref:LacI family transcriptional regulator n=1 Tax=Actinomadura harenae TaxID=2483351 RepID=A0A3M2LXZ9_9ACTN|nr:LacI family DNA-binding transcriptional regulator [Actinomadura harenae]RMI42279.1 LacI family transcriptional regulator [Actinomadura harenae]